jgi:hypothetical protein
LGLNPWKKQFSHATNPLVLDVELNETILKNPSHIQAKIQDNCIQEFECLNLKLQEKNGIRRLVLKMKWKEGFDMNMDRLCYMMLTSCLAQSFVKLGVKKALLWEFFGFP